MERYTISVASNMLKISKNRKRAKDKDTSILQEQN